MALARYSHLLLAAGMFMAGAAVACVSTEQPDFSKLLQGPTSVFVFRVESSELRTEFVSEQISAPRITGRIRVVEVLRGAPPGFTRMEFSAVCDTLRLDVGSYFVVATDQSGKTLVLEGEGASVLSLGDRYDEALPARRAPHDVLRAVMSYLDGEGLPRGFPSEEQKSRTRRYVPPEPAAGRVR